ncbi:uncharacterized protein LOC121305743 [Polyodon spathula]|uniref:uncharacterized protein LOC121305743 n=1 Tax=Polyodon spathula TaxID=7913 RepID=UPI001B7DF134|nr:uncharacterized protein LOC121305743 [Polyodon spathula]
MDNGADSLCFSNSVSADHRGIGLAPSIQANTVTSSCNINIYQGTAAEKRKERDHEEEPEKKKPKPLSESEPGDAVDSRPVLTEYSLSKMEEYADRNREYLIGLLENEDGLQERKEKLKSMKLKKNLDWNCVKARKINKDFKSFVSQSKFPWSEVESFLFEKVGKAAERGRMEVDDGSCNSSGYFSSVNTEDFRSSSTLSQPVPASPLEEDQRKNHRPGEKEDRELSQGLQTGPASHARSSAEEPSGDTAREPSGDTAEELSGDTAPSAEQQRDSPAPKKTFTQPSNSAAETKKEQKVNPGAKGVKKEMPKGVIYDSDGYSTAGGGLSAQTQVKEESTKVLVGQIAPSAEHMETSSSATERINSREQTQDPSPQLNHEEGNQHRKKGSKQTIARKDKAAEEESRNKAFKRWLEHTAQSLAEKEGRIVEEVKKQMESNLEITFVDNCEHTKFKCLTARECTVFEHEGERVMLHIDKRDKCLTPKHNQFKEGFTFQLQYTMWILGGITGTDVVFSDADDEIQKYKFHEAGLEEFHVNFPQIINKVFLPAMALYKQAQREKVFH